MRSITSLFTVASTAALAVMAAPSEPRSHITKRQAHPVDYEEACRGIMPAHNECVLVAATGIRTVWDGTGPGLGSDDTMAVLLDNACSVIQAKEWDRNTPGFSTVFEGNLPNEEAATWFKVEASVPTIGEVPGIGNFDIAVDGEEVPYQTCGDTEIGMGDAISSGVWKQCNFPCPYRSI